jgi:hypothetical protein
MPSPGMDRLYILYQQLTKTHLQCALYTGKKRSLRPNGSIQHFFCPAHSNWISHSLCELKQTLII